MESIVADSTCLIGLERIGRLDILSILFETVIIPPEVAREFGGSFSWLQLETLASGALASSLRLVVDAGEAEAIALASEKSCRLIADDKQARAVAEQIGEFFEKPFFRVILDRILLFLLVHLVPWFRFLTTDQEETRRNKRNKTERFGHFSFFKKEDLT